MARLQKLKRGERISATAWNGVIDALNKLLTLRVSGNLQLRDVGGTLSLTSPMRGGVRFQNNASSGVSPIPPYGCMRIEGLGGTSQAPYFLVGQPNSDFFGLYLLNGAGAVAAGYYGTGYFALDGDAQWAAFQAEAADEPKDQPFYGATWGPTPDQWYLTKNRYGFEIAGVAVPPEGSDEGDDEETTDDESGDDEDEEDESDDDEDEDDEGGADELTTLGRVLVQQHRVVLAKGTLQSALRNFADIDHPADFDQAQADVDVQYALVNLADDPITWEESSTGQTARKCLAWNLLPKNQFISGDQVTIAFMHGQWYVIQSATCPEATPPKVGS